MFLIKSIQQFKSRLFELKRKRIPSPHQLKTPHFYRISTKFPSNFHQKLWRPSELQFEGQNWENLNTNPINCIELIISINQNFHSLYEISYNIFDHQKILRFSSKFMKFPLFTKLNAQNLISFVYFINFSSVLNWENFIIIFFLL